MPVVPAWDYGVFSILSHGQVHLTLEFLQACSSFSLAELQDSETARAAASKALITYPKVGRTLILNTLWDSGSHQKQTHCLTCRSLHKNTFQSYYTRQAVGPLWKGWVNISLLKQSPLENYFCFWAMTQTRTLAPPGPAFCPETGEPRTNGEPGPPIGGNRRSPLGLLAVTAPERPGREGSAPRGSPANPEAQPFLGFPLSKGSVLPQRSKTQRQPRIWWQEGFLASEY